MAAHTGHGLAQPSRRRFLTRPWELARASASISPQRAGQRRPGLLLGTADAVEPSW
jgi:hypothetical protein